MKQKLLGIGVLIAALCLMTACSTGGGAGSAAGSQPDSSTPQASTSAPADQSTPSQEPDTSADASAPADGSAPADASAEPETPDSSAPAQEPEEKQEGKPLFTGSFAEGANPTSLGDPNEDSYIQSMEVEGATITLGRFSTNHSTEAYMDEYYNPSEFEVTEPVTVSGNSGTHYRWKTGGEESTVVDAVVVEADGYSLLFLSCVPQAAYEGMLSTTTPNQETVEGWIASLTVSK